LAVGEQRESGAQGAPDAVERVAGAAAVPEGLLLHAAADLVDGVEAELHDVEGVEDADRVGQLRAHALAYPAYP
jgi:hypothetical protein